MTSTGRTTIQDFNEIIDIKKLKPIGDYVLVEVLEKTKTLGGLHLLKGKGTPCVIGRVISIGKELPNSHHVGGYPIGVEPGDYILTMEYVGDQMSLRDGQYRFIHAHGLWAKLKMKNVETYEIEHIEPLFAYVVVRPVDDEVTKGGIIIAAGHSADEQLRKARVIKVGPGQWHAKSGRRIPVPLESDVDILMLRYAGAEIEVAGEELRIIDYSDVKVITED